MFDEFIREIGRVEGCEIIVFTDDGVVLVWDEFRRSWMREVVRRWRELFNGL